MEIDETLSGFEETSSMKKCSPQAQGNDAAMEQLIKRSKKGAKLQVIIYLISLFYPRLLLLASLKDTDDKK